MVSHKSLILSLTLCLVYVKGIRFYHYTVRKLGKYNMLMINIILCSVAELGLTRGGGYRGVWGNGPPRQVGGSGLSSGKIVKIELKNFGFKVVYKGFLLKVF